MKLILPAVVLALAGAAYAVPTFDQVRAAYRSSDAELLDRHGEAIQSLRIDMAVRRLPWVALATSRRHCRRRCCRRRTSASTNTMAWTGARRPRRRGTTCSAASARRLDHHHAAGGAARSGFAAGRRAAAGQKWDQVQAARELDAQWSKQQIMEAYLNLVSYRGELQGWARRRAACSARRRRDWTERVGDSCQPAARSGGRAESRGAARLCAGA
jgi:penicillin-binding protein 1C